MLYEGCDKGCFKGFVKGSFKVSFKDSRSLMFLRFRAEGCAGPQRIPVSGLRLEVW